VLRYTATPQQLLSSSAVEASQRKQLKESHLISLALDGSLGGSTGVIWVSFACSVAGTRRSQCLSNQLKVAKKKD